MFGHPRERFSIGSLDDLSVFVHAQYNPKDVQVKRTVPWTEHQDVSVEFTGVKGRAVSVELLFDGFEQRRSVQPQLDVLERLANVRDPHSKQEELLRPHRCLVAWGAMPKLQCVIESVTVKYTMFAADGTPLRAVANVELKEALSMDQRKREREHR